MNKFNETSSQLFNLLVLCPRKNHIEPANLYSAYSLLKRKKNIFQRKWLNQDNLVCWNQHVNSSSEELLNEILLIFLSFITIQFYRSYIHDQKDASPAVRLLFDLLGQIDIDMYLHADGDNGLLPFHLCSEQLLKTLWLFSGSRQLFSQDPNYFFCWNVSWHVASNWKIFSSTKLYHFSSRWLLLNNAI